MVDCTSSRTSICFKPDKTYYFRSFVALICNISADLQLLSRLDRTVLTSTRQPVYLSAYISPLFPLPPCQLLTLSSRFIRRVDLNWMRGSNIPKRKLERASRSGISNQHQHQNQHQNQHQHQPLSLAIAPAPAPVAINGI